MIVLNDIASNHGTDAISILPREDLRSAGLRLHIHLVVEVNSLQFYLNNLQDKGLFLVDGSFDNSSMDEPVFRKFIIDPATIHQIISGMGTPPIPPPSIK